MKHKPSFTHGNTTIYLKSLRCERIQLSNGISRDYINVVNNDNGTRTIWSAYLFLVSQGIFRTSKTSKEYKEQTLDTATGYHNITLYCDKNKPHHFSIHKLIGKVFNLHYEENPVKGVSQDPRKDQIQTSSLYQSGTHIEPKSEFSLVIDHIDGVKDNNDIRNLRPVTQRNNTITSNGKPCVLYDPETNEREEYRSMSLAQDAIGYRFNMNGGQTCRYLVGSMKSKGLFWKGQTRKRLWFSYIDENGVIEQPREDYTNRKPTPATVEDPATGEKRSYDRIADAERGIGGKKITFGKNRGKTIPTMNVMWLGSRRSKLFITKEE